MKNNIEEDERKRNKSIMKSILKNIFKNYDFKFKIKDIGGETFEIIIKNQKQRSRKYVFHFAWTPICNGITIYLSNEGIGRYHGSQGVELEDNFWEKMFMYHLFD